MEKDSDFKEFKKQIKKRFPEIKDIAIERWNNGTMYYVFYCKNNEIGLMRTSDTIPMFSYHNSLRTFPHLELISFKGHSVFKVDDSRYLFGNGERNVFNPATDSKKYGDKEYVVMGTDPTHVFALDGTHLLMADDVEFRDAVPAGFSHDAATGMSIYHPALPPRFFGRNEYPHLSDYGMGVAYSLGFFESPNSSNFNIKVPGGEYFIYQEGSNKFLTKKEFREDANGVMHEYKVFEVGERNEGYNVYTRSLCRHGGTTGVPVIKGKITQIRISTPDQIVYYSVYDPDNFMYRTGCVSLIDSTFRVEPRFADVNVFYDSEKKPYALVRLSSLGEYEVYDPAKPYDYASMSKLELAYEKQQWHDVISQIKPSKIEEFQEKDLMIWFKAETENIKPMIEMQENALTRIATNTLWESERKELEKEADGTVAPYTWYTPIRFSSDYNLEDALEYFAKKYTSEKADNYTTLAAYVKELRKRQNRLDDEVKEARAEYVKNLKESRRQMELARQQQLIDAMNARQENEALQQAAMLQVLNALTGVITNALTSSSSAAPAKASASVALPKSNTGNSMLDKTYISPEVTGMAISAGWTPDYSTSATEVSSTPSSSSSSHATSSRICHACYGSGKCPHCHGAGRYAPNLNGHVIDCEPCHKSGTCHACNGAGRH